jgi:hypothetical protein
MTEDADLIRRKVRAAFQGNVSDDFVLQFLAELRTSMRDTEKGTRRATTLIVVLAVTFELVHRGAVAEASFFFVKVASLNFILVGIPVVIAYLSYEAAALAVESNNFFWVHRKLIELKYPSVEAHGLDLFAIPGTDPFGQAMRDVRFRRRKPVLRVAAWLRFPLFIMVPPLGGVAFEAYAYVQLIRHHHINPAILLVTATLTGVLVTLAIARVATETPHGGGPWREH